MGLVGVCAGGYGVCGGRGCVEVVAGGVTVHVYGGVYMWGPPPNMPPSHTLPPHCAQLLPSSSSAGIRPLRLWHGPRTPTQLLFFLPVTTSLMPPACYHLPPACLPLLLPPPATATSPPPATAISSLPTHHCCHVSPTCHHPSLVHCYCSLTCEAGIRALLWVRVGAQCALLLWE